MPHMLQETKIQSKYANMQLTFNCMALGCSSWTRSRRFSAHDWHPVLIMIRHTDRLGRLDRLLTTENHYMVVLETGMRCPEPASCRVSWDVTDLGVRAPTGRTRFLNDD